MPIHLEKASAVIAIVSRCFQWPFPPAGLQPEPTVRFVRKEMVNGNGD
jgi:hypothetical protein